VDIVSIEDCILFDSNLFPGCADLMPVSHIVICVVNVQASRNGIRVCDLVNDFDVFSEKYVLPPCVFRVQFNCNNCLINQNSVCQALNLLIIFNELLASFNLVQVVDVSTHREGNTLDIVITRRDCPPTNCTVQLPTIISNHGLVTCRLSSSSLATQRNNVTMRPWKKLDMSAFTASLRSSVVCTMETDVLRQMSAD